MLSLAVIPARGGSKRLPRKNIAEFMGKPIIAYTIEAALNSRLFDSVVVTTEDSEIAAVAESHGAQVHARPQHLARDDVGVVAVCLDLLDREAEIGRTFDRFTCLYPTAPLRTAIDIANVVALLEPGVCDFAIAVCTYSHPPHQALVRQDDGGLIPFLPDWVNRRSQDVPPLVVDNGSTYAVHVPAFQAHKSFYGPALRGHLMPRERSVDIDEVADLSLARFFASRAIDEEEGL